MLEQLSSIADLKVRAAALDVRVRADVRGSAIALDAIARRAAHGDARCRDVLLAFVWLRVTRDDLRPIDALAAVAPQSPLFRTTSAARGLGARARTEPFVPARRAVRAFSNHVVHYVNGGETVAHYFQAARMPGWFAHDRDRALRDPRASVIARVLASPVELRDVLRIASRRPSTPDVARAVAASRYLGELSVREALVRNPFTPAWLSLILLPTVRRRVVDLAVAHEEVRAYARFLE